MLFHSLDSAQRNSKLFFGNLRVGRGKTINDDNSKDVVFVL